MSIGFKIRKLREEHDLSQPKLASALQISQSELSKIENGQTKKIDFLFMDKVAKYFNKNLEYFIDSNAQTNNVKKNLGTIAYNVETINNYPENNNILAEIQKLIADNIEKDLLIVALREEKRKWKE